MLEIKWREDTGRPGERQTHIRHSDNGVTYMTFDPLDKESWLDNAFSTRLGGVSEGYFAEMNLCFGRGDPDETVRENFRIFGRAVGFSIDDLVISAQTHTTNVIRVGADDRGLGITRTEHLNDIDGLITNERYVGLILEFADCVPLYFADPVHHAIGLSHSGWKGTANRMGEVTVKAMQNAFGSDPADLIAVIGPSICQDCYEVSEDVACHFPASCLIDKGNGKYQLDLAEANRLILKESGLKPQNIYKPDLCTRCNPDLLFSHRATQGKRGNLGAFLMIK